MSSQRNVDGLRVPGSGPRAHRSIQVTGGSEPVGRRHPVNERAEASLLDREHKRHEALLGGGVLQRTRVDRLVAGVAVQPLDDLAGFLVPAPQVARPLSLASPSRS